MSTTAANLRDLHQLHRRATALRDRLASGPKTLAARELALKNRQAALEAARKTLQDSKVQLKKREHAVQGVQAKMDDLRGKLNQVKKNDEYKAIQNQLAHDKAALEKLEGEILEEMMKVDEQTASVADAEAEVKKFASDVAALRAEIESQAESQQGQLRELEGAIVESEEVIPEDLRDRYRRTVKQHGADALSAVEGGACSGCYVSVTPQMLNELINLEHLTFCKTCGRILYLAEEHEHTTRRTVR